jgi:hypothetical protein
MPATNGSEYTTDSLDQTMLKPVRHHYGEQSNGQESAHGRRLRFKLHSEQH